MAGRADWKYLVAGHYNHVYVDAKADDPRRPEELAIEVGVANEGLLEMELLAFKTRGDIAFVTLTCQHPDRDSKHWLDTMLDTWRDHYKAHGMELLT